MPLLNPNSPEDFRHRHSAEDDAARKDEEERYLRRFLRSYNRVMGINVELMRSHESPDFICRDDQNRPFGVELSCIHPPEAFDKHKSPYTNFIAPDPFDAFEEIARLIEKKERSRSNNYGEWSNRTVLLLGLAAYPLAEFQFHLTQQGPEKFQDHGFQEIWLADCTEPDAFPDFELFALFPFEKWGFYEREIQKPYG